jgi:NADH dehydrogenase [ubiquinone] 1 alpha subcomplex assembly factor 2
MQWLRHTRHDPPSLAEQQANVVRQEQIKVLAARADARWAAVPSALDAPDKQQPMQMLESKDSSSGIKQMNVDQETREHTETPHESIDGIKQEDIADEKFAHDEAHGTVGDTNANAPTLKTRTVMREPIAKDSPWQKPGTANADQAWQPESWTPPPARRRA